MSRKRGHVLVLLTESPWWVSMLIAAVVYAAMSWIIPSIRFSSRSLNSLAAVMPKFAWVFGVLFLYIALIAFIKQRRRQRLFDTRRNLESIRALSWQEFELLIGEAFRRKGYSVEERGGAGPDGGVDLVLRKNGERSIVQCKHWKTQQIGVNVVRELLGSMTAENVRKGFLVTTGRFTNEAQAFAQGKQIDLIAGDELQQLIPAARLRERQSQNRGAPVLAAAEISIPCPKCGSRMVQRTAKRGENAGKRFWGCSTYPKCNGIRQL